MILFNRFKFKSSVLSVVKFIVVITLTITLLGVTSVYSQGYWGKRTITQNDPPATELVVARWKYGTNGWFRHLGWSHNYPYSDEHLNQFIIETTGINIDVMSYRIIDLGSDEVFDYPFAYVSEPGEMELTEREVINLREFVERGGFILMDDFDGPQQIANMQLNVRKSFPDREFVPLNVNHRIFQSHFELDDLNGMSPYVPGGEIIYYGIFNDHGDIAIAAGHNNDLANFWDWYDQPRMPLKPATDAFRLGINMIVYSMTH